MAPDTREVEISEVGNMQRTRSWSDLPPGLSPPKILSPRVPLANPPFEMRDNPGQAQIDFPVPDENTSLLSQGAQRKGFPPPQAIYENYVGGSMVRHGRFLFNWWLPVVTIFNIYIFHHCWEGKTFWGIMYISFKDAPADLTEQISSRGIKPFDLYSFSMRETHDALKEDNMPWFAALVFFSSHIFRYSRLVLNILLWYWPIMPDMWRVHMLTALEFIGKWSLYEVFLLGFLFSLAELDLTMTVTGVEINLWEQHGFLGPAASWYLSGVLVSHFLGCFLMHEVVRIKNVREEVVAAHMPLMGNENNLETTVTWTATYSNCAESAGLYGRIWYVGIPGIILVNAALYFLALCNHEFDVKTMIYTLQQDNEAYTLLETATETIYLAALSDDKDDRRGKNMVGWIVVMGIFYVPLLRMVVQFVMWVGHFSRAWHSFFEGVHRLSLQCSILDISILAAFLTFYKASGLSRHLVDCTLSDDDTDDDPGQNCFDISVDRKIGYNYIVYSMLLSYLVNSVITHMAARSKEMVREDPVRQPTVVTTSGGRL